MSLPLWLRRNVIQRAGGRCEYCTLSQSGQEARFHIDHVIPVAEGGPTELDNLALACVSCSLRKGARRTALDPVTAKQANLFHPRLENWDSHFRWRGNRVEGITATGRATLRLLHLNRASIVAIREEERLRGRHPPKT